MVGDDGRVSTDASRRLRLGLLVAGLCAALLATVALAVTAPAPVQGDPTAAERLPDLDQDLPGAPRITPVTQGGRVRYRIGFDSSVRNVGSGPLIVEGRRAADEEEMTADQVVRREDGSEARYPGVGRIYFETSHNHWHLREFDTFELRRTDDYGLVAPDQKQGFCIGDRTYPADDFRPASPAPAAAVGAYPNHCRPGDRAALDWGAQGISVGWGDLYEAFLEGQYIDVTDVPPGEYWLVHHANALRGLRESDYANNAARLRIRLWPGGYGDTTVAPAVLARDAEAPLPPPATEPEPPSSSPAPAPTSGRADARPPASPEGGRAGGVGNTLPPERIDPAILGAGRAERLVRAAIRRRLGSRVRLAATDCARRTGARFDCRIRATTRRHRFSGVVRVTVSRTRRAAWSYSMRLTRTDRRTHARRRIVVRTTPAA